MPTLKSMKRSQQEIQEKESALTSPDEDPYPWGLRLQLDKDSLEKLGLTLPQVGEKVEIAALANVTEVRSEESVEFGSERSVSLQITDLGVAPAQTDPGEKLYPGMNRGGGE